MLNLILAVVWLTLALVAFLMPRLRPEGPPWTIPNTDISLFWVGLFFFGYNLMRWWTSRSPRREYKIIRPTPPRHVSDEPPNPDFDFSDGPKK